MTTSFDPSPGLTAPPETPTFLDDVLEELDLLLGPCPDIKPYGSSLENLPSNWVAPTTGKPEA